MKVDIFSENTVYEGFLKVKKANLQYQKFNGDMSATVTRESLERGDSVAALLFDEKTQELTLVKQFRYPALANGDGWLVEIVAGMIDPDETPQTAITREIKEETGMDVLDLKPISCFYVSPGGTSERIFLYLALVQEPDTPIERVSNTDEDIQILKLSERGLRLMLKNNDILDGKTLIAIQYFLYKYLPRTSSGD